MIEAIQDCAGKSVEGEDLVDPVIGRIEARVQHIHIERRAADGLGDLSENGVELNKRCARGA